MTDGCEYAEQQLGLCRLFSVNDAESAAPIQDTSVCQRYTLARYTSFLLTKCLWTIFLESSRPPRVWFSQPYIRWYRLS